MANARLLAVEVERFKSYLGRKRLEVAPITVLVGRNNSGKSTLIQPLLLLKQALAISRPELALNLQGELVSARSIRDLTHGWPAMGADVQGPSFAVEWESTVHLPSVLEKTGVNSQISTIAKRAGLPWLKEAYQGQISLKVRLEVEFQEREGIATVRQVRLVLLHPQPTVDAVFKRQADGRYGMWWSGKPAVESAHVTLDHYLPYVDVSQVSLGRNDALRSYLNGWLTCFAPTIEDLRLLLDDLQYLSSARETPKETNPPVSAPPNEVGPSGALAAEMFKARGRELVHYLPPVGIDGTEAAEVRERSLAAAVNDVLLELGVEGSFSIDDAALFGFRLMFGNASLPHVGRSLTYLLPVVEVGLLGDPCRFTSLGGDKPLAEYRQRAGRSMPILLEEPESHLHPKVQSRLAHWLVALARCNRQIIVETHSDHLVRRLRGLVARSGPGSAMEKWLLDSVRIYAVEQKGGVSDLTEMKLTREGGLGEQWPADFMDEASDEDSAIYYSALSKRGDAPEPPELVHDEGGVEPPDDKSESEGKR
jgi:energy-coupling factor transporter ATP-binding protein EcfA2